MSTHNKTRRPSITTVIIVSSLLFFGNSVIADEGVKVNVDNFVRVETAAQIDRGLKMMKGVNKWWHSYEPIPLDKQNVVRMNRDTLYSSAVVDISKGATLTLPDSGKRYMSVMTLNEDHYVVKVFHKGGTYKLTMKEFGTPYLILAARTLANANDPEDIKKANALQNQMKIEAVSARPYTHPNYDKVSYDSTFKALVQLSEGLSNTKNMFGNKDEVTETRHLIGTAFGYAGLPEYEAFYITKSEPKKAGTFQLTVKDVPVDGFWSISIYNKDGFLEKNKFDSYSINNLTAKPNKDGSITVNFGTDPEGKENFLYVMDGWNYAIRLYQPRKEILNDTWMFPEPKPVK
jgi:hypothetical protein